MTPVFCCGFECGQAGTVGEHWTFGGSGISFATDIVRSGSRSLKGIFSTSFGNATSNSIGGTVIVARFYFYFSSISGGQTLFTCTSAGGTICWLSIIVTTNNFFSLSISGGINTEDILAVAGQWYLIDIKVDVSNNPNTFNGKINGVSLTQKTRAVAASTLTTIILGPTDNKTGTLYWDDVLVSKTSADYPMGAGRVNHFVPTSDGTHNIAGAADFRRGGTTTDILNGTTTAYQLVDDVPLDDTTPDTDDHIRIVAPANATDYVECVYGPAAGISVPTVAPRAVEVIAEFFAAGTGLSDEILKLNDNGTVDNVYDGTQIAGTTTGIYKRKHYALAPTGGAWTVVSGAGNFNNIRFRYGYATDANPDKSLMCTMIEAEFDEFRHRQDDIVQPYRQKKLISPSGQKNNSNVT